MGGVDDFRYEICVFSGLNLGSRDAINRVSTDVVDTTIQQRLMGNC